MFKVTLDPSFIDLLWNMGHVFETKLPSWAAYMSDRCSAVLPVSKVFMLPVINLHVTDYNALFSFLSYIAKRSKELNIPLPCVTFDQQPYIIAFEIVVSKNMKIFVRIGGFHQLMSFLGAIGTLMEGSGLRPALETVYSPVTVNHMFSGKAIARSLRGDMFAASAVFSILLEKVWSQLDDGEKERVKVMYHNNLNLEDSDSVLEEKLIKLCGQVQKVYEEKSRTAQLWLNYVRYVFIAQQFIRAERTSNWELHVTTTKCMLNLLAATGHNPYTKSLRLYLQSIEELKLKISGSLQSIPRWRSYSKTNDKDLVWNMDRLFN